MGPGDISPYHDYTQQPRYGAIFTNVPNPNVPTTTGKVHPNMEISPPPATAVDALVDPATGLQKYSCILCKERKIKCDRNTPCASCTKSSVSCIYKAPAPPRRRKRAGSDSGDKKSEPGKRKIQKYEEILRRNGIDVDADEGHGAGESRSSGSPSTGSGGPVSSRHRSELQASRQPYAFTGTSIGTGLYPRNTEETQQDKPYLTYATNAPYTVTPLIGSQPAAERRASTTYEPASYYQIKDPYPSNRIPDASKDGQLVVRGNKARYVESNLWKVVSAEASGQVLESSSEESDDEDLAPKKSTSTLALGEGAGGLILGITDTAQKKVQHPNTAMIFQLWQIFLDNCNPILHVIHAPTLQQEIIGVLGDPDNMSKSLCCLLCSIYALAVLSMDPEDCQAKLGEPKDELLQRYTGFTRLALIDAAFLRTSDINVLIAFTLHIISMSAEGDFESRWELAGVAMRIAQRLGLHKDPESLGIDPFNCEMRRRLWNQLWVLDIRCAEFAGCKTALPPDSENVKAPTNCSDSALYPGMKSMPVEQDGFTEMTFMLLRVRLGQFLRKVGNASGTLKGWDWIISPETPLEEKQEAIREAERSLSQVTKHCDMEVPIQATTVRISTIVLNKLRWLAHHPRRGVQAKEDQMKYAIDLIEVEANTRLNKTVAKFMWHAQNTLQFDSLFFILAELRKHHTGEQVDRAWSVLKLVYQATPIVQIKQSKIFSALRNMTLSAWETRESAIGPIADTPEFITQLKKNRDRKQKHSGTGATPDTSMGPPGLTPDGTGSATAQSGTVSTTAASPLFATDTMEEIDWQMWDEVFSTELDPAYGQWMHGNGK